MATNVIVGSGKVGFNGIGLKIYHLISRITCNSCPKFNVYLVSKTCLLISLKISSKVFFCSNLFLK
jgi:hypothetical protein